MTILFFSLGIIVLLTLILTVCFWSKICFELLSRICTCLVLSLPFEYFPRAELVGASWRISQLVVIMAFWVIIILLLKKDRQLLSHRIHFASYYPLIFFILSSPSWFFIQDFQRFIVHLVGTIFVFGAFVLLSNFATDIWKSLKRLVIVLFGCSLFGLYQFFGDIVGISPFFTLLREHYTKVVFGVPRIQGTAVEPLYFAGMLMVAIFVLIFWICESLEFQKKLQPSSINLETSNLLYYSTSVLPNLSQQLRSNSNFMEIIFTKLAVHKVKSLSIILLIIFTVFLLTISKGTFGVLTILILPLFVTIFLVFNFFRQYIYTNLFQGILVMLLLGIIFFNFANPIALLGEIGTNFVETLSGTSASAMERSMFSNQAITGIKQNPIFGIGMGQYGSYVGNNLGVLNDDGKAIVNNVYLEIWLEEGILVLFFFVFLLLQPIVILLKFLATQWSLLRAETFAALSFVFILVGYYLQWTLFSPIFIMPIFIILGLAYNLISNYHN